MRQLTYRIETLSFYAYTDIEEYLEKMVQKGWMLESIHSYFWKYRRIEPKKLHFSVNYFPAASEFDPYPPESQKTFHEFCEEAGWKLVATKAQMQIFCNEAEDPVPIETDAQLQLGVIQKAMKKNYISSTTALLFIGLLEVLFFLLMYSSNPLDFFTSSSALYSVFCWLIVMLICSMELITYFNWLDRAEKAARLDGSFIESHGHTYFQLFLSALVLVLFAIWAGSLESLQTKLTLILYFGEIVLLCFIVGMLKKFLKHRQIPAKKARVIVWISCFALAFALPIGLNFFRDRLSGSLISEKERSLESYEHNGITKYIYQDELPLYIKDFTETDYSEYSRELHTQTSWIMTQYRATERPMPGSADVPDLSYTLVTGKIPALTDYCFKKLVAEPERKNYRLPEEDRNHYVEEDAAAWNAEQAYRLYLGKEPSNIYLIRWNETFMRFDFPQELTLEQKQIISRKVSGM